MLNRERRPDLLTPEQWAACATARLVRPTRHRRFVRLKWERAPDDADGVQVHIDRATARLHGPGRAHLEFRIYVNGQLAGRGVASGCSLGFGGNDLPAVTIIATNLALTVDNAFAGPEPIVELWTVADGPVDLPFAEAGAWQSDRAERVLARFAAGLLSRRRSGISHLLGRPFMGRW
jgi:hypothetical protein